MNFALLIGHSPTSELKEANTKQHNLEQKIIKSREKNSNHNSMANQVLSALRLRSSLGSFLDKNNSSSNVDSSGSTSVTDSISSLDDDSSTTSSIYTTPPTPKQEQSKRQQQQQQQKKQKQQKQKKLKPKKFVRFSPMVIEHPGIDMAQKDIRKLWIRSKDIIDTKGRLQKVGRMALSDKNYTKALEHVREFLLRKNPYFIIDIDEYNFNNNEKEHEMMSPEDYCARTELAAAILCRGDRRGVERSVMASMDRVQGRTRPIERHRTIVLQTQQQLLRHNNNNTNSLSYDDISLAIAKQCNTEPALLWAQALGAADEVEAKQEKFVYYI